MNATLVAPDQARALILAGRAPAGMYVNGHLDLVGCKHLSALPEGLSVRRLTLRDCPALHALPAGLRCDELVIQAVPITTLPADLQVRYRLDVSDCTELTSLPAGPKAGTLSARNCFALTSLPAELELVTVTLNNCRDLDRLPEGLTAASLILRFCPALKALPEGLRVIYLDIAGCPGLTHWPDRGSVRVARVSLRGCVGFSCLPNWLTNLAELDVSGCANLAELPEGMRVSSWLDIAGTQIRALPQSLHGVQLRWRGVAVDERIACHPETITSREALAEQNAERRRVLVERMGYDAFMAQARPDVLDADRDPGGERRLLRVSLGGDEPLVCLAVQCPSTGRRYMLRVPPGTRTCHQAAAWIAGCDNPDDYHPVAES